MCVCVCVCVCVCECVYVYACGIYAYTHIFTYATTQARTQGGCPGCPGNHLFVLKYLIWFNKNILFDISFKKGLVKGRLTNGINKRAKADAEISDNRNGPQVGYDQALYPRLHDIFDFLCF